MAATGGGAIISNAGGYEVGGQSLTESALLAKAEVSSANVKTAAKAFVTATKQIEAAQKELNTSLKVSAQSANVPAARATSVGDIYGKVDKASENLSSTLQSSSQNKQNLNAETLIQNALNLLKEQTSEGRKRVQDLEKENNLINDQIALIANGTLPALAEAEAIQERRSNLESTLIKNAADEYKKQINAIEGLGEDERANTLSRITQELERQLGIIDAQDTRYRELSQSQRDSLALLEASRIQSQAGVAGKGLRAGFINEAASAYEDQISKGVSPEMAANVAKATEQLTLAQMQANSLQNAANGIGDAFAQSFSDIATGAQTVQASLGQLFKNIAKMFADMAAQLIAKWLIMKAIGLVASIFGGGGGDAGPKSEGLQWNPSTLDFDPVKSANGNVLVGGFRAFANGGVVNGPTLGLVGEGRFNEAVVPLPDGRKIPVDLGGSTGNNISTNIVVNMNNGQASSQSSGRGNQAFGRELEGAVRSVIMKETRPGGLIYNKG